MSEIHLTRLSRVRTRWAAIGAAVAVALGAGGIGIVNATQPAGALAFVPITPCRIFDTRPGTDNVGAKSSPFGPGQTHTFSAHGNPGQCAGIPKAATGLSLNVTAVGASELTFLTIWPTGQKRPLASSLNPSPGQPPTPNAVTTALSPTGQFDVYNLTGSVHVLADVNGYYTDHNHDDRYLRASIEDSISVAGGGFVPTYGDKTGSPGNSFCFRTVNPDSWMFHSVPVPAGSTVTAVTANAQAPSAQQYHLLVTRRRPGATDVDFIAKSGPHSVGPGAASTLIPLYSAILVEPGDSLMLTFVQYQTGPKTVELCSAQVHFTRPG